MVAIEAVPVVSTPLRQDRINIMAQVVQFDEYGDLDVLHVVDVPAPTPGPGQVRIAVRAAAINPIEWKIVAGLMREMRPLEFPAGLGTDVAGVVDDIGAGVTGIDVGDSVLGSAATGSFAQFALAEATRLVHKPAAMSWVVAGSLAGAGGTAYVTLNELELRSGETLLVHAAAGGVGTFAVQLAVARGAKVIGTASERNHDYLRALGAVPVAYGEGWADRVRQIAPEGVDAVLDASGRGEIPLSVELTGNAARVLTLVAFDAADTRIRKHVGGAGDQLGNALRELVELVEKGRLRTAVSQTYPLAKVAEALRTSREGHLTGKFVILPAPAADSPER